jgi:hypothetical protein
MANRDTVPFSPEDVAREIVDGWLFDGSLTKANAFDTVADIAEALNRFYGIKLQPEHISNLSQNALTIDELTQLIEPMRNWPAMMGKMPDWWDWRIEMPRDSRSLC